MHGLTGGSWKRSADLTTVIEKNSPGGKLHGLKWLRDLPSTDPTAPASDPPSNVFGDQRAGPFDFAHQRSPHNLAGPRRVAINRWRRRFQLHHPGGNPNQDHNAHTRQNDLASLLSLEDCRVALNVHCHSHTLCKTRGRTGSSLQLKEKQRVIAVCPPRSSWPGYSLPGHPNPGTGDIRGVCP